MIVFVVNCGSSSIKYQLINMEGERVMAKGLIERIGMEGSTLKHTPAGKYTIDLKEEIPDHKVGIRLAIKALTSKEYGVIKDMSEIDAVGHRVVHGGERFTDSVLITSDVLRGIEACCEIAPLHNRRWLFLIRPFIRRCRRLHIFTACPMKCMSNMVCAVTASTVPRINMLLCVLRS